VIQTDAFRETLDREMRGSSWRYTALGILALVLGTFGIVYAGVVTLTSVFVFGAALLIGGVVHLVNVLRYRDWNGLLVQLPIGITEIVVGTLMLSKPGASLLGLTLVTAAFLIIVGVFRAIFAASVQFPSWGWAFASGVASILLGTFVWWEWPVSSLWLLGTFVSVYLVMSGWAYVMLGAAMRSSAPRPSTAAPQPMT
jgi:uncharacterized membrane protein HdeD (DUF308 family)